MDPKRSTSFPDFTPTSGELARSAAAQWGDKPLAILGDERLSYAEADARSAALAKGLLASGAGKGTRVGLLAGNSPDWIVGWLGITRMGGVAVLLNTYSKAKELGWLLRHCRRPGAAHRRPPPRPRLPRAPRAGDPRPGRPGRTSGSSSSRIPYLRSIWTWGDGRRPWAAPVADLVGARRVGHRRAAPRVRERGHPGRPDGGRVLLRVAPPTRRAPSTPTAPPCATPTTSGRCATSSPTTCSTRRCRCSGSAASASR